MAACNHASIVIDAPMDLVWDMTNDVASWPELFNDYAATEILGAEGDTTRFRVTMRPDERGSSHGWAAERAVDPAKRTARMRQLDGHAFDFMDISWQYVETAGGVELRWVHEFHVSDAMPYDDNAMVALLQKTVPLQLAHIKKQIETAAGRSRPFRVLLRFDVHPGTEERFEQTWLSIAERIGREPANQGQWLMKSTDEEAVYYVVSEWTDATSFRAFELSSEHVENRRRLDEFRRGGSMTSLALVHALTGGAAPVAVG
ncbi:SRPBCC family protein [Amycolatopsis nigrescens]|uniref:SRPBCC family protein n=1 Tax=Amycolatopsis nigrescens TaxID=381445 RepID=UPI0003744A98|nr:SRPBCC family protein [Amycolatopsis nigrescens]